MRNIILLTFILFISGCVSETESIINTDEVADTGIIALEATITDLDIFILESFPVQVRLGITGYLEDSCTELGETVINQADNTFFIRMPAIKKVGETCAQVEVPFTETINLDVLGLEKGDYIVNVNSVTNSFNIAVDNISQE